MKETNKRTFRCAIYTRVSTDQGLEQDFNSLDAQREASEAYIKSQAHEGWRLMRDRYDDGGYSGGSMDRPALQKLLADVEARRIDVIVVYKVDRLTRSLADFAKLVEMFDKRDVSFVSVTQSFNTTTSMGRLTLNVLLSFAQFEREVTGERIRDKIAASKKKGMWMGGVVPLGYRVEDRALHVVEDHAETVRSLFRRYLEAGTVVRLKEQLDAESFRIPIRIDGAARSTGGGLFSRGHIYKILSNPIYVGRIAHKGQVNEGQHPPIVTQDLWGQVQQGLRDHLGTVRTKRTHQSSDALLIGKLYDDSGNRMSPTWAKKGSKRWRYYVSQAALQGDRSKAGSVIRVPAANVEALVTEALGKVSSNVAASQTDIRNLIDRVVIGRSTPPMSRGDGRKDHRRPHWDLIRASSQVEIDPHLVSPVPAAQCSRAVAVGNPKFGVRKLTSPFVVQGRSSGQNRPYNIDRFYEPRRAPWRSLGEQPRRSPGLGEPRVQPFGVPHVDLVETLSPSSERLARKIWPRRVERPEST